ncbi:MAG: hypothetical protein ABI120_26120 [Gemmatimonadaceae bacterium]
MERNDRNNRSTTKTLRPHLLAMTGVFCVLAATAHAANAGAQVRANMTSEGKRAADSIPADYNPPAGMCRVWLDGVPAAQQPAPTDCPTATRKKPVNARVIYGDDPKSKGSAVKSALPVKGFAPPSVKRSPVNAAVPPVGYADQRFRAQGEDKRLTDDQLFGDRPANMPASSYPGSAVGGAPYPGSPYPGAANGQAGYPNNAGGILGDPRYFNPGVKPPGTGSGVCLDRDQDGWCDDSRFGPPVCLDQDKDGRCDDLPEYASLAYPQTLPRMRSLLDVVEGRGSVEVARWLGTNEFTVRIPDQASGATPWRAIFLDSRNELLQVWTDRNRDGLAERVEIFRNGQRVKLIQR